jgi:F0F1-type ATP synthase assembly protein I
MKERGDDLPTGASMSDMRAESSWHDRWPGLSALWAVSIGWELVVPVGVGAVVGHTLDRRFGTGATVTIALLVLGVVVGYYNVVRFIRLATEWDRRQARGKMDGAP